MEIPSEIISKIDLHFLICLHLAGITSNNFEQTTLFNHSDERASARYEKIIDTYRKSADQIMEYFRKNPYCYIIKYSDPQYPALLRFIDKAPLILFVKGHIDLLNKNLVSAVGTRKPGSASKSIASIVTSFLSEAGFTTVSGMADGIDSCVHRNSMKPSGTIGILAHGFDHCYPQINFDLYKLSGKSSDICLMSEYPPSEKPKRYYFPKRNRLISGMSRCTLLFHAGIKSGAMITAKYALDQGREVFVCIHDLIHENEGAEQLLRDGALNLLNYFNIYTKNIYKPAEALHAAMENWHYAEAGIWLKTERNSIEQTENIVNLLTGFSPLERKPGK